ncbi:hypothetical protein BGX23_008525 [Mortierella sp. AD031]|nr:hypothetical protein BGX23_008525 [Mortierella sp. AD031]
MNPPAKPISSQQPCSPLRVNLARPKCFCGFTSVSVYPEPTTTTDSTSKPLRKTNWVYECHFTPKQKGMVKPEPCEDCEEDRWRHLVRSKGNSATGTKGSSLISEGVKKKKKKRHTADAFDEVELWPKKTGTTTPAKAALISGLEIRQPNSSGTTMTTTPPIVGADIANPSTFLGLSPMDGKKVCGFHMHALEWHHMQTVGIEQILALAKQTNCDVFNFSVIRWLGDRVRPISGNNSNNTSSNSNSSNSNRDRGSNLNLSLFRKINCHCRREAVIAQAPTIPATYNRPGTKGDRHYVIVCRGRAHVDPKFEIVLPPLDGPYFFGYYNRTWVQPGGSVYRCQFCISVDIAIYGHATDTIHKWIPNNEWLSQWLQPSPTPNPTSTLTLAPRPSSVSTRTLTAAPQRGVNHMVSTLRKPPAVESKRSLTLTQTSPSPLMPTTTSRQTSTWTLPSTGLLTAQNLGYFGRPRSTSASFSAADHGLAAQGRDQLGRDSIGLEGLDKELEESVAWHAAEVESILDADESWFTPMQEFYSDYGYSNYREIDMDTYPSVAMLLCKYCTDNTTDFCVIPCRIKHGSPTASPPTTTGTNIWTTNGFLPPSPPSSTDGDLDTRDEADLLTGLGCMNPGLESVDKELGRIMRRHAEGFSKTMETRSRLMWYRAATSSSALIVST